MNMNISGLFHILLLLLLQTLNALKYYVRDPVHPVHPVHPFHPVLADLDTIIATLLLYRLGKMYKEMIRSSHDWWTSGK